MKTKTKDLQNEKILDFIDDFLFENITCPNNKNERFTIRDYKMKTKTNFIPTIEMNEDDFEVVDMEELKNEIKKATCDEILRRIEKEARFIRENIRDKNNKDKWWYSREDIKEIVNEVRDK